MGELRKMGLPAVHLRVAEAIGYDAFVTAWKIYDADPFVERDEGVMVINLRSFRAYLRYQRNRYVEALAALGMSWRDIQRRVKEELCEKVSRRHITRLMQGV